MNRKISIIAVGLVIVISIVVVLLIGVKEKARQNPSTPNIVELSIKSRQKLEKIDNIDIKEKIQNKKLGFGLSWHAGRKGIKNPVEDNNLSFNYKFQSDNILEEYKHFEIFVSKDGTKRSLGKTSEKGRSYDHEYFKIRCDAKEQEIAIKIKDINRFKKDFKNDGITVIFENLHDITIGIEVVINAIE